MNDHRSPADDVVSIRQDIYFYTGLRRRIQCVPMRNYKRIFHLLRYRVQYVFRTQAHEKMLRLLDNLF